MERQMESGANSSKRMHVAILMATYNGIRYIKEQIESLLNQSYGDWTLYIHDDGSTDGTQAVIQDYANQHENIKILILGHSGGAKNNFLDMLQTVDAEYYMFCDQDDVWLPEKIEVSIEHMRQCEAINPNRPIIVFSDLTVVDQSLNVIQDSFMEMSCIYPAYINTFDEMAALSITTGCTMLMNRKVKEGIPCWKHADILMHDSWLTLCTVKNGGKLCFVDKQLTLYRQHHDNTIGAKDSKRLTLSYRIRHILEIWRSNQDYYRMLKLLSYGSLPKFYWNKLKYKYRVKKEKR